MSGSVEKTGKTKNPNVNCLAGKRCPNCGSFGPFVVEAVVDMKITDDGTEQIGDTIFYVDADARCRQCDYSGKWSDFDEK